MRKTKRKKAKPKKGFDPTWGKSLVNNQVVAFPDHDPYVIKGELGHVTADKLKHIRVKAYCHIWHVVNNIAKSLTNSPQLALLERQLDFKVDRLMSLMCSLHGDEGKLPDGFIFANHSTQTGNFIPSSDGWTPEVQNELLKNNLITCDNND